jgi:hypothetical protein
VTKLPEAVLKSRKLWLPRMKEADKPCKSCPFSDGNDKEFGAVIRALKKKHGMAHEDGATVAGARAQARHDVVFGGRQDFACHATAYGPDMEVRSRSEHRQCPGAARAYKGEE